MWPASRHWQDPLGDSALGGVLPDGEHLRARIIGEGSAVVFLHGLGASIRYWGRSYDLLAARHRLVFFDLLGFGGFASLGLANPVLQQDTLNRIWQAAMTAPDLPPPPGPNPGPPPPTPRQPRPPMS